MKRFASLLVLALSLSACATHFSGAAHFPGGAQACFASCQAQNMEMGGFVYSGEFASSCVCRPRPTPGAPVSQASDAATAAEVSSLVGVVMQMRRSGAAANSSSR